MKSDRIKKYLKTGVKFKLFERNLEFWNLFENWSLENYLKIRGFLRIGILKIIWELEFWKLNLRIEVLEIKFERNWKFENYLRIGVRKIKFKNWSFGN